MIAKSKSLLLAPTLGFLLSTTTWASTGIDPTNKLAWAENTGWVNASPTNQGITIHYNGTSGYLSGLTWGENIGWIKLGSDPGGPYANTTATDWGVNLNAAGNLSGLAWGENIGWIKFNSASNQVTINMITGTFDGYAWGENMGWIHFRGTAPDYNVRTIAFDTQSLGTPNWWMTQYGISDENNFGVKGTPLWQDYVADTDPTNPASRFQISVISNISPLTVYFPSSSRRYYTLQRRENLQTGIWSNVTDQIGVRGVGGLDSLQDTTTGSQQFYRVEVNVSP
ncbi:MAG: hypothetical protein WCI03_14050 [bacterium]